MILPALQIYIVIACVIWYVLSRVALVATWWWSAKRSYRPMHYIYGLIALCPFALEFVSTMFTLLALRHGLAPLRKY